MGNSDASQFITSAHPTVCTRSDIWNRFLAAQCICACIFKLDSPRQRSDHASALLSPERQQPEPTEQEAGWAPSMTPVVGLFHFCGERITKMQIFFSVIARQPPVEPGPPHPRGFTITLRHTTLGRTPTEKWPARRADLYLTTHITHKRRTSMPRTVFEPTIPKRERPQTDALDRAATDRQNAISVYEISYCRHSNRVRIW